MEASEGAKDRARMRILQRLRLVDVWGLPDRLGMPFSTRLSTVFGAAFVGGFALGGAHGSAMAGYRYRAENAHRFPTNNKGWYLYHKSKNYHMTVGAVKSGIKLGARLGVWSGLFIVVEGAWDHLRNGTADAFSSMMAGLTIAGTYSLKNRHDMYTTARIVKTSFKFGALYGFTQDILTLAKGGRVSYVDAVLTYTRGFVTS